MAPLVTVTGASGHIGSFIVRGLLAQKRRVRAIYVGEAPALEGLDVEHVKVDITDREAITKALAGSEVVYHVAALISLHERDKERMHRVNVEGVKNVVDACVTHGVRKLVHFSSIHAYHPLPAGQTVDETSPLATPTSRIPSYDKSKAAGTKHVHAGVARGLDAVLLHPVGVIGPCDFKPSQIGDGMIKIANREVPAMVEGGFQWVDVRDVAATALAAETKGRTGEHYIIGGPWFAMSDISNMVSRAVGSPPIRLVTPMWVARAALPFVHAFAWLTNTETPYNSAALHAIRNHRNVSYDKATRELGHKPRPTEESVYDTLRWFQGRGLIKPTLQPRLTAESETAPAPGN